MHITQVIQNYGLSITGPSNHAKALTNVLAAVNHQLAVISATNATKAYIQQNGNIEHIYLPTYARLMQYYFVKNLHRTLLSHHTDVFHVHSWRSQIADTTVRIAKKRGIPVILQAHGTANAIKIVKSATNFPLATVPYKIYDAMFKKNTVLKADVILATTTNEAQECINYGCDPEKIVVIPLGINTEQYNSSKQNNNHSPTLLMVGRLDRARNIHVLIDALAIVKKTIPNFECRIVGPEVQNSQASKSGYLTELKQQCKTLNLTKHITFTGPKTGKDLLDEYKKADVFIYPSSYENFGLPIIEAASAGLAVIASNTGVVSDLIEDNQNGIILNKIDHHLLAQKLIHLLKNPLTIRKFGTKIQHKCQQNYELNKIVQQHLNLYQQLTKNSP